MPGERVGPVLRDRRRGPPLCCFLLFLKIFVIIFCVFICIVCVFCLSVCMSATSVPGAQGGAQDIIESLGLELQTAMCEGAGC